MNLIDHFEVEPPKHSVDKPIVPFYKIKSRKPNGTNPMFKLPEPEEDEHFKYITNDVVDNVIPGRYMVSDHGKTYDTWMEKFVSYSSNRSEDNEKRNGEGYYTVHIGVYSNSEGYLSKTKYPHRIVLQTFNPTDNKDLEVNHMDLNKRNNNLSNLEWRTKKENYKHMVEHGRMPVGCDRYNALYSEEQVKEICERIVQGQRLVDIAKDMNIPVSKLSNIKTGNSYKNITDNYDLPFIKPKASVLTEEKVREICELIEKNKPNYEISEITGTALHVIADIRLKKNYTNISSEYNITPYSGGKINKRRDPETIHEVCRRLENHQDKSDIANELNIPWYVVYDVYKRRRYTGISKDYNW